MITKWNTSTIALAIMMSTAFSAQANEQLSLFQSNLSLTSIGGFTSAEVSEQPIFERPLLPIRRDLGTDNSFPLSVSSSEIDPFSFTQGLIDTSVGGLSSSWATFPPIAREMNPITPATLAEDFSDTFIINSPIPPSPGFQIQLIQPEIQPVPEPSTLALCGLLLGLMGISRKRASCRH